MQTRKHIKGVLQEMFEIYHYKNPGIALTPVGVMALFIVAIWGIVTLGTAFIPGVSCPEQLVRMTDIAFGAVFGRGLGKYSTKNSTKTA